MAHTQKIVWVSGAAGFSGGYLIRFLRTLREPLCIIGFDIRKAEPAGLDAYYQIDITDPSKIRDLAARQPPNRVIHLAGVLPPTAEVDLWRINVGGTLNLLQVLADLKAPELRFVTIGSVAEYSEFSSRRIRENQSGGGSSPYGRTKWVQSTLAVAFGKQMRMKTMVARTFNLIGPGTPLSLVPGALCAQFAAGQREIKVGNLRPERDFVDIRDAVAAYWIICEKGKPGNIYNVCTGKTASIGKLVELFRECSGKDVRIQTDAKRTRKNDLDRVCGDNARLLKLGCRPRITLKQSVREMLENARSQ
jgi:GDP-4-dehydro-6-deoxy-D-mannose reductase